MRDVLRTAKNVYNGQFTRVAGTALVVFGGVGVLDALVSHRAEGEEDPLVVASLVGAAVFLSFGSTFYAGLLDRLVGSQAFGHSDQSILTVLRSLPYGRLVVADVILTLAITAASIFFLIPGLIVFTRFALVGALINIEDLSVGAVFRRSSQLVKGHFWLVFLLATLPLTLEDQLETVIDVAIHGESLLVAFAVHGLFGSIVGAIIGLIEVSLAYELVARNPAERV